MAAARQPCISDARARRNKAAARRQIAVAAAAAIEGTAEEEIGPSVSSLAITGSIGPRTFAPLAARPLAAGSLRCITLCIPNLRVAQHGVRVEKDAGNPRRPRPRSG